MNVAMRSHIKILKYDAQYSYQYLWHDLFRGAPFVCFLSKSKRDICPLVERCPGKDLGPPALLDLEQWIGLRKSGSGPLDLLDFWHLSTATVTVARISPANQMVIIPTNGLRVN